MVLRKTLTLLWMFHCVFAELPTELDPFMEKLFDADECEDFISGDYNAIATSECDPFTCDFPRQLCMRAAANYRDKSANECRNIPTECLTAANDGVPLGPPRIIGPIPTQKPPGRPEPGWKGHGGPEPKIITVRPSMALDICEMEAPTGRFCGFKVKYTYNKDTKQCDDFWFPGCPTSETNANLFDTLHDCQIIARMCVNALTTPPPTTTTPAPLFTFPPPPPPPAPTAAPWLPQKPHPGRPHPGRPHPGPRGPHPGPRGPHNGHHGHGHGGQGQGGAGGPDFGGFGGLGGLGSVLGTGMGPAGSGIPNGAGEDKEDMDLLGLIQKSLSSAQAIKQGGPKGKAAAANAAGDLLQQFTGFDLNNLGGNFGNFFNGR